MSDPDRLLALLEAFRESLATLARYRATVPRARLLADRDTQNMVLFALYRAIHGAIDLGQHLIAERGLRVPSSYREVFAVLGEAAVLDAALAGRLQGWGGLRNVIAHQYASLDVERVATAVYDELPDLEALAAAVARLLTEEAGG